MLRESQEKEGAAASTATGPTTGPATTAAAAAVCFVGLPLS